ncbi:MAG: SH3 domain-containing protein, partial [Clostridiales bacterium]|nr:SH3 domain-containing protein [Clostridiales bacterium]
NLGIAHVENHLNIRAIPGTDGKLVGKMSNNAACEIISISNGWAQIKSGEVEGYVNLEFLLLGQEARERANQVVSTVATVTADSLKVREQPNTDCEVITQVPTGEELDVVDTDTQGWVKVLLDDEEVFVASEFVSVAEQLKTAVTMTELLYGEGVSDLRVDLCQYAKEFLGNPYVWGGTSLTKGADCSGFTMSVFKNFGYSLSHSSKAQASSGTKVSVSEAVAGDLVFYAKGGSINHVAIYIGNGQVIHASSPSTGIRISSVYYRTPYTVRRILP